MDWRLSALGLAILFGLSFLPATIQAAEIELPPVVEVPAGPFLAGSDSEEREFGYQLDERAYGHSITRKNDWYDSERKRVRVSLSSYSIMRDLVTNRQYRDFVRETGRGVPSIKPKAWKVQGLIHPYKRALRHMWRNGTFPEGRADHPVVMVTWDDANAFAEWLSNKTDRKWRLPTELEWEKAARGADGRIFPWGNEWDPTRLNSHDKGPFDTMPVGAFPNGKSPYGMRDAAGQVFEWTSTPAGKGRYIVKGGSWDDKGCGVCRAAARHSRPHDIRHILVGFRLVLAD